MLHAVVATDVVADPVGDRCGRETGAVDQADDSSTRFVDLGQVLAEHDPPRPRPKRVRMWSWCSPPSAGGRAIRTRPPRDRPVGAKLHLVPPTKPRSGSVPPNSSDWIWPPKWPCQPRGRRRSSRRSMRAGVHHETPPHQPRRVGEAVGRAGGAPSSSRRRAVPMPFAAHSTTSAAWKCSLPVGGRATSRRVARPRPSTSMRRTRAPGDESCAAAMARGQCVTSVDPLAPSLQPDPHVPRCTHA